MEPSNQPANDPLAAPAARPEALNQSRPVTNYLVPLTLPLDDILVEDRLRVDLGDVEELAESVRDNGLLQPLVVERRVDGETVKYSLRCGGRRYAALTLLRTNKVPNPNPSEYDKVSVRIYNEMPEHQRIVIEIEENLRRKDLGWLEKTIGIVRYHKASKRAALLNGEKWSQQMTGDLLNMDQASVSVAFTVYDAIQAGNEKVRDAESLTEALKVITSGELDAAQAEQMRRITLKRQEVKEVRHDVSAVDATLPRVSSILVQSANKNQPETVADKVQFTKEQIADFYHQGDCLELIPKIAAQQTINHIICDPPYGIDMDNLVMEGVERIAETHTVEGNLELIPAFLEVAYEAIAIDGFLCMWYDLDHHEKIAKWATDIGWKVQRWPLVWCKTSTCRNSAAQYNITKSTEVCYFMRRSSNSVIKCKQSRNYIEAGSVATAHHPFVKPFELWDYLLDTVSSPNQSILDPFAGEGSSLAAAFKKGRLPIGCEVDPKLIAGGLSYIQEQINKKSILDDILTEAPI